MKQRFVCGAVLGLSLVSLHGAVYAGDSIPKAAWKRGIGEPLSHAGTKKTNLEVIDDGYWQGAPVGGFGAGTFARTYAGNFSRWRLKTGVNKYETLYAISSPGISGWKDRRQALPGSCLPTILVAGR